MEDKTSKPDFNKSNGAEKPKFHRNYTGKEMIQIIDGYASVAKTPEQEKDMLDIKDDYIRTREQRIASMPARDRYYQDGIEAGLHPRETLENLDRQAREQDQRDRNRAVDKAKTYYHRNYSLSKDFKESLNRPRPKDRDMTKE